MFDFMSWFVTVNRRASHLFDSALAEEWRKDGNRDFLDNVFPLELAKGMKVYDVGGGRHPCVTAEQKADLCLVLVGVDIDVAELKSAPIGTYDEIIVQDIANLGGDGDGDLVVCQSLLEHVIDVPAAVQSIASLLKAGGRATVFFPSRHAMFARLNRVLPQRIKKLLLHGIFPASRDRQGFPSYYNHCTERDFTELAQSAGMRVVEIRRYWMSDYFSFFFPVHVLWRCSQLVARTLSGNRAAETLSFVLARDCER